MKAEIKWSLKEINVKQIHKKQVWKNSLFRW